MVSRINVTVTACLEEQEKKKKSCQLFWPVAVLLKLLLSLGICLGHFVPSPPGASLALEGTLML